MSKMYYSNTLINLFNKFAKNLLNACLFFILIASYTDRVYANLPSDNARYAILSNVNEGNNHYIKSLGKVNTNAPNAINVRATSLSGIVGFPAFDNLQRCGSPDTTVGL